LLSLRYPRRYFSTTHGVAQRRFSGYLQVNTYGYVHQHLRCQSASAACKLRQVVIGTLQAIAPCTCIEALMRRILLFAMVYYKARGVPCGFRTCIGWLALDRLLMVVSAAEFTIHGDINNSTSQIRQASSSSPHRIRSSPTTREELLTYYSTRNEICQRCYRLAFSEDRNCSHPSQFWTCSNARFEQAPASQTRRFLFSTPSRNPFI
jgi:hypothetical protein